MLHLHCVDDFTHLPLPSTYFLLVHSLNAGCPAFSLQVVLQEFSFLMIILSFRDYHSVLLSYRLSFLNLAFVPPVSLATPVAFPLN